MSGRKALGLGLFALMAAALAAHELPREVLNDLEMDWTAEKKVWKDVAILYSSRPRRRDFLECRLWVLLVP